jgi:hypothetical protein
MQLVILLGMVALRDKGVNIWDEHGSREYIDKAVNILL